MRASLLSIVLLGACADEPSFDEQFNKQSAEIAREAEKVDRELKQQIELVPEAGEAEKPPPDPAAVGE